jgi:hypothetical protein
VSGSKLLRVSLLATACLLPVGMVYADAAATNAPLDLRMPDLRSIPTLDRITCCAGSEEPEDVSVSGAPRPAKRTSYLHASQTGIGSLYWGFHHPGEVWRVVLPIAPDDGSTESEDMRLK